MNPEAKPTMTVRTLSFLCALCALCGEPAFAASPSLGSILDGITRASILEIAAEEGVLCTERALSCEELASADEAFLTATSYLVAPIASIDGRALTVEAPGPVTDKLRKRFARVIGGEDARFAEWLTAV